MNAIIFHGTDLKPTDFWYPWLESELKKRGFRVDVPAYPDINHKPVAEFIPEVLSAHHFDNETVLIGHSSGASLILSILERIDRKVAQAILVAGYSEPLPGPADPILQPSYDWERIRAHSDDFVFINSANDPWGCDDVQGRRMFDRLGGTQIIRNDGHFGSESFNQSYEEFPLLLGLVKGVV